MWRPRAGGVRKPNGAPRNVRWRGVVSAEGPDARLAGIHTDLLEHGLAVRDEFLSADGVRELIACAERRRQRGGFRAAQIGADVRRQRREDVRGDSTCWWQEPLFEAERRLLDDLEKLRLQLNREAFLGLLDHELHYAWYPPGAGYARHVDRPQGRDRRSLSFIVYLNEGWVPDAGGELRVFDDRGGYADLAPLGGRFVCFLTEGREHAVLATHVDRLSVTGWFRCREIL